jgi:hypothetical protein
MEFKKYRKLIAIVIFLAMIGGLYYFVIEKMLAKIEAKKIQIQEDAAIQENQRKRLGDVQRLKDDFEMVGGVEEKVGSFLDKNKAVDFIQEIEKLSDGTNNRVEIEVVPADLPVKGKTTAKESGETIASSLPAKDYLQFKIKTSGSFLGLIKLISQLENSKYYLDVVSLQINANPELGAEENRETLGKTNPFSSDQDGGVKNSEEVVGMITVVVYTQAQK